MRKRGNMWLRRSVLAGALVVFLAAGVSACGTGRVSGSGTESEQNAADARKAAAEAGNTDQDAGKSGNGSGGELQQDGSGQSGRAVSAPVWSNMKPERSMELSYAKQFSVDYYDGGYDLIQVQDDST